MIFFSDASYISKSFEAVFLFIREVLRYLGSIYYQNDLETLDTHQRSHAYCVFDYEFFKLYLKNKISILFLCKFRILINEFRFKLTESLIKKVRIIFRISHSWRGTIRKGRSIRISSSRPSVVIRPHCRVSYIDKIGNSSYLDTKTIHPTNPKSQQYRDTESNEVVEVHKAIKPVYWVFKYLFDEDRKPKAIKLAKKAWKDGYFPWKLTEFGVEAAKLHRNACIYLIKRKTQVLKEDLLKKHVHFSESLKNENK
jgi:hypothetical protein